MSDDILGDPEFQAWAKRAQDELVPKLVDSALTVSIVPDGDADIKFAVELGLSIMLGKPIILAVPAGTKVPDKLVQIADEIVELDFEKPQASATALGKAAGRVREKYGL